MTRRRGFRQGDWESVAGRLDEILCAHGGDDPLGVALELVVAKLEHEAARHETVFLDPRADEAPLAQERRLLEAAACRWPGVVEHARTAIDELALERCAAVLREVELSADDLAGLDALFEVLVHSAHKGEKGQYFTPRHVARELAAMLAPRPGERIVDPACGSAGLVRQALAIEPRCEAWGFDVDARATRIGRAALAVIGAPPSRIGVCDSLARGGIEATMRAHAPRYDGFDIVITNPPFAGDVGRAYARGYELARAGHTERDVLFLERALELLRPGGRLGIVLPHNKLGGSSFEGLRSWLLERLRVVAVVGLGRNTFKPHTGQKTCVLFGIKRPSLGQQAASEEILFALSERDGKDARGRLRRRADGVGVDHDLPELVDEVARRMERASEELSR
jgi:type I restriction enzyme M protein